MPTSATGRSSRPRFRARAHASGFTLLEVLVVVVIIAIITGMAVVSVRVLGGDHEMDQEAARLAAVLTQARDDAMLQGRDLGMRVDAGGYDFLRYDTRNEQWVLVTDDPLLRERTLPAGVGLELRLESQPVQLPLRTIPSALAPASPQVVVQASGDLVPFEILLQRAGTREIRHVTGAADGTITSGEADEATSR
jgi:general secretion pathway protein H